MRTEEIYKLVLDILEETERVEATFFKKLPSMCP